MEATIILKYKNEKIARSIANAIIPDNYNTPQGLIIKTTRKKFTVLTEIYAKNKISTFIATIDDLLSSTLTAEKAIKFLEKERTSL